MMPYIPEMTLRDYVCQGKKEEEDLPALKNSVDTSIQGLEDYIEKRGGRLITATRNNTDNTRINRRKITWK